VRFLGSGLSAIVHEYTDGSSSYVFKFFKSIYHEQFEKEVEIYRVLMSKEISKEMLWYNRSRCLICLRSVRQLVDIYNISIFGIKNAYKFLFDFHQVTGNIHRDIYFKILLISSEHKIFLNNFALSILPNSESPVKGNLYFASDAVLMSENDKHIYQISDDIYSLTFTLIYIIYEKKFYPLFQVISSLRSIYMHRKKLIEQFECKDLIVSALQFASDLDYEKAHDWII
jgi:hypothetical protein